MTFDDMFLTDDDISAAAMRDHPLTDAEILDAAADIFGDDLDDPPFDEEDEGVRDLVRHTGRKDLQDLLSLLGDD